MTTTLRTAIGIALGIAVAGLGLTACSSGGGNSSGSVGCGSLTLGFSGAKTGNSAYAGQSQYDAIQLAIRDHNKKKGACKAKIAVYDDQGDPGQTPALMQKAASDKNVVAIIGPGFSGTAQVAGPILNEAGLPMVTSAATDSALANNGWKVFHRTEASSDDESAHDANYIATTLQAKRVFVINNQTTYGVGLAKPLVTALGKLNVTTSTAAVDPNSQDYSSAVSAIKSFNADQVYCGCYVPEGSALLKQLRDAGVTAGYYGPGSFVDPKLVSLAGKAAAEGTHYSTSSKAPTEIVGAARFASEWKAAYGGTPPGYTAETYDAADAILRAIDAGKRSRSSINDWLKTCDFEGVSGTIKFDTTGNLISAATSIFVIKNGKTVFVQMAKAA